jgi:hypothetical protein
MVIDNVSAVAWTDSRNTKHPEAQCALRIMGLLEATSHVFTSSEHIPGEKNVWADAGSRSWDTEDSMLTWQPTWNDREQDLGHPVASSGAGRVRARDRRQTCPADASAQTLV